MKKLFLTALIAVSPMTFSQDFNPDLLVGKWQCKDQGYLFNNTTHITENSTREYKADGTHTFEFSQMMATKAPFGLWFTFRKKVKGSGIWKLNNDILTLNRTYVTEYQSTPNNLILEEKYRNNHEFYDLQFQEFSKDSFMLIYPEKTADKLEGNVVENCERIR